jgi:hypothetical protein
VLGGGVGSGGVVCLACMDMLVVWHDMHVPVACLCACMLACLLACLGAWGGGVVGGGAVVAVRERVIGWGREVGGCATWRCFFESLRERERERRGRIG